MPKLTHLRPEELQAAVARRLPLVMAAGVIEYHGPHLPIGTDFLIANAIIEGAVARCDAIEAPPLTFGPTMSWAADSDEGEVDFEPEPFFQYVREAFRHFVRMGFRRIYVLQHHQGPEGLQSLCLRRAAAEVQRELGRGFGPRWGRGSTADLPIPEIFSLIRIAYCDTFSRYPSDKPERIPIGHGSKGETQLMQAAHPDTVRMTALDEFPPPLPRWLQDSHLGTPEEGRRWLEFCIAGWVRELSCQA